MIFRFQNKRQQWEFTLLSVQMAEYTHFTSKQDLIMNILTGVNPYTGKVEYGVTDDQISDIKTNYEQDAQSIIG